MEDVPEALFFFETSEAVQVGTLRYVAAFKTRAGHEVLALLERPPTPALEEKISSLCEEVDRGAIADPEGEHISPAVRASIRRDEDLFQALDLLKPMVSAARVVARTTKLKNRYFVALSREKGPIHRFGQIASCFAKGQLATKGLDFPKIRTSFEQLKLRDVDSVEALRPFAGHWGTNVLPRFYLNSPDIIQELLQSIRFFQNAVQALVVAETGIVLALADGDHRWFYNLAHASGIAGAIGFGASVSAEVEEPPWRFEPTDANLVSLIVTHLSLRKARREWDAYRWSVMGVPLMGFVIGIETALQKAGLRGLFKNLARETIVKYRAGEISLPRLF